MSGRKRHVIPQKNRNGEIHLSETQIVLSPKVPLNYCIQTVSLNKSNIMYKANVSVAEAKDQQKKIAKFVW